MGLRMDGRTKVPTKVTSQPNQKFSHSWVSQIFLAMGLRARGAPLQSGYKFSVCGCIPKVWIQMKATEQYFPVVLFVMLYKVVISFQSVDAFQKCEFKWKLLSSTLLWWFVMLYKVVLTFYSVDENLNCDHSNESYWAVLSCGVVQCGRMFWVHGWNPEVTSLVINSVGPLSLVLHGLGINRSKMIWILQIVLLSKKQLASISIGSPNWVNIVLRTDTRENILTGKSFLYLHLQMNIQTKGTPLTEIWFEK